jgi:hypothetical protein
MKCVAALVCAGCTLLPAPALAVVHPDDARATRAYLRAGQTYARNAAAKLDASVGAIETREREIAAGCPFALTYAPRDAAFEEIGEEAKQTLLDAGAASTRAARLAYARALDRLDWSEPRLTRLVHERAAEELAPATIALPDVCADIEAWKASAYAIVPQSTSEFLARSGKSESGPLASLLLLFEEPRKTKIARLLRRFESAREARRAMLIERQEEHTSSEVGRAGKAAAQTLAAWLGITAL